MGEPGPDLRHVLASRLHARPNRRQVAQRGTLASDLGRQSREPSWSSSTAVPSTLVAHADGCSNAKVPPGRSSAAAFAHPTLGSTQWNADPEKTASNGSSGSDTSSKRPR